MSFPNSHVGCSKRFVKQGCSGLSFCHYSSFSWDFLQQYSLKFIFLVSGSFSVPSSTYTFFRLLKASFMLLVTVLIVIPSFLGFASSWLLAFSVLCLLLCAALPNSVPPHLPTYQQICSKNSSSEVLTGSNQIQNTSEIFFILHWLLAASYLFPFVI